ncbi:FAD-dependent monooxygenase [Kitasatospora sp. HPMI-4]|uniref:FAD-dependent monooxygenase n=1 Tax=Kitasatospora sp. HPMI-4 TaxID=3448443 RepID=UPI003F1C6F90
MSSTRPSAAATDVLVVGAGPVGLTLALGLARSGVSCRVIESEPAFRDRGVRGRGVNSRTLEVFDDLGVVDEIYARAEVNLRLRTYEGSRLVSEVDPAPSNTPLPDRPYLGLVMLAQHHTEAVLRDRLAGFGVRVELGTALTGFTQDAERVVATVRRGDRTERISARYLVGCDGGRSTVRRSAGLPFLGETWDEERFLMGSLRVDGLDPHCLHAWQDREFGVGALVLVPQTCDGTWGISAAVVPDGDGRLPEPSLENFRRIFAERAALPGVRLHDLVWSSVWRPTVRMVERYRSGRVFLAGDAAHCHSAAGGQGMNTGIQDAHNLGWKLAAALRGAPDTLLDSYQAERLPVARAVLTASSAQHRALFTAGGGAALTRQFVDKTGIAPGTDLSGLTVNYRGGPLGCDLDDSTGIRAGDRAPDAPCRTAQGEPLRLFDLLRGPHFTLLSFGDRPAPQASAVPGTRVVTVGGHAGADLVDVEGHARRAYGVSGDAVVLVRPDGFVGLTGGPVGPEPVTAYLDGLTAAGRRPAARV